METLAQRAALLRESLDRSKQVTDAVVSILGSFDSRLSALDSAMRPIQVPAPLSLPPLSYLLGVTIIVYARDLTVLRRCVQVRTHAVRTAHENIDRTLRSADVILTQFDRTRGVLASNFESPL
jgi:exocyst complex component 7